MLESMRSFRTEGLPPGFMVKFHSVFTLVFLALIPPSMLFWSESVPYLVAISVWANFAGHLSAWQAARVEVKQDEPDDHWLSAKFMLRFHAVATVVFFILIPPSMLLWENSVPYLVAISVWANFAGHLAAWQAARVEVNQDEQS